MVEQVVVRVLNCRSEGAYVFGPMSAGDVIGFVDRLPGHMVATEVNVLNAPELAGTGQESEFDITWVGE